MRITELSLSCHRLKDQLVFYRDTLGLPILEEQPDQFITQVGWTKLRFEQAQEAHFYHYCFLLPSNQLAEGMRWLQSRLDLVPVGEDQHVQHFESWNADSVYFWDGAGNLAECIVRYNLANTDDTLFTAKQLLCVNEIGLPTTDIAQLNQQLTNSLGTSFWKGDLERFGTHGSQEGLLLLPNYQKKRTWYPTDLHVQAEPLRGVLDVNHKKYALSYVHEKLDLRVIR